jgi:hypothetical protein
MKHNTNSRRGRNRGSGGGGGGPGGGGAGGNGKRHVPLRSQTFDSTGPDGKIRGTAQQVLDRYLALGRDAHVAGDPITAESFYQHAEHYYRLLHAEGADGPRPRPAETPSDPTGEEGALEAVGGDTADEAASRLPL